MSIVHTIYVHTCSYQHASLKAITVIQLYMMYNTWTLPDLKLIAFSSVVWTHVTHQAGDRLSWHALAMPI